MYLTHSCSLLYVIPTCSRLYDGVLSSSITYHFETHLVWNDNLLSGWSWLVHRVHIPEHILQIFNRFYLFSFCIGLLCTKYPKVLTVLHLVPFPISPPPVTSVRYPGTTFMDHIIRYQDDTAVKLIIVLGEVCHSPSMQIRSYLVKCTQYRPMYSTV